MHATSHRRRLRGAAAIALAAVAVSAAAITGLGAAAANAAPVPNPLGHVPDRTVASLIAPNGDRDPFGIAVVPLTSGDLTAGNLLVAEFSDKNGTAGAGDNDPAGQPRHRSDQRVLPGRSRGGSGRYRHQPGQRRRLDR